MGRYSFPGSGAKTSLWVSLHASRVLLDGKAAMRSPRAFGCENWYGKSGVEVSVAA